MEGGAVALVTGAPPFVISILTGIPLSPPVATFIDPARVGRHAFAIITMTTTAIPANVHPTEIPTIEPRESPSPSALSNSHATPASSPLPRVALQECTPHPSNGQSTSRVSCPSHWTLSIQ